MNNEFDISKFNIIQDEENYYFFRALNMGDNSDVEKGITMVNGEITKIRTDRERWSESPENPISKYSVEDEISLEQVYDHIKINQRKDTNCISLSSDSSISIFYGREFYKDRYILVKVPKIDFGKKVKVAGEYLLSEIEKRVESEIEKISSDSENKMLEKIEKIDFANSIDEIVDIVFEKYAFNGEAKIYKSKNDKINSAQNMSGRFSNYQTLNANQNLEKNRLFAKVTILEYYGRMEKIIPNTSSNSDLLKTVKRAFDSFELINYGDINKENFIEVSSEVMERFVNFQKTRNEMCLVEKIFNGNFAE